MLCIINIILYFNNYRLLWTCLEWLVNLDQSVDNPYEEIFGVPLTKINFKLMDDS